MGAFADRSVRVLGVSFIVLPFLIVAALTLDIPFTVLDSWIDGARAASQPVDESRRCRAGAQPFGDDPFDAAIWGRHGFAGAGLLLGGATRFIRCDDALSRPNSHSGGHGQRTVSDGAHPGVVCRSASGYSLL